MRKSNAAIVESLVAMTTKWELLICTLIHICLFTLFIYFNLILIYRFLSKKGLDDSNIDASSFEEISSLNNM